ncbi:Ribosomal RNA small subunit methyltransferase H [Planktothrix agardhii]|uniref:Ribosomal RNA small subunit methyltransferase H n=1 Tax=Planktothrix agardhii TaxID=1160 RepID=A0A1J1JIA1_PLAAG|nr:16S rRNA (cytosine(1402)-N(4))-methyltransferase RsmH [Planktothrix agardhii]MBG0747383.1 16S rRNA (cytosine(1402)-N(4))-methyltransferase RsmH [Planktothrix agardhii KL2]BBD53944.1 S-adenosyl-methyltransferase MraW [Planktothrix agardhii NIES-204]CAD5909826.1 Ribosomal RNA small subunit methyltransferase H [Planktothrix agardhii]CAD5921538.1 Ribosomal RNA small subunit methyltransferase H [Planktothrix agardhii]CAD5925905.1 Ribosomal RNA small subunit methyltransferase H [Planktothrix agar
MSEIETVEENTQTSPSTELRTGFVHIPVLSRELIAGLEICAGGEYLDATVGGGGHSLLLLQAGENIQLTAIDQDQEAIAAARVKFEQADPSFLERVQFWQGNFTQYNPKSKQFDGIIADLGVSSYQFDQPERGFSFRHTAPLDMRMNQQQSLTAAEIINHWDEKQLADIFHHYGEERLSRRIAKRIVEKRPFQTTTDLAYAIGGCVPASYRHGRIHPATRVFQALRIAVNQELTCLEKFIDQAQYWLKPGGRIGVISFHSLEDRIVKHRFKESPILQVLTKKPIQPQPDELNNNHRSRSAKLRLAERKIIE